MDISSVMQDIKNRKPKSFYIFAGEEVAIRDIYINKIAECINVKPIRADSVESIMGKISSKSFISSAQCYVISDDVDFMKAENVWQDFVDAKIQNNNIVIICCNSLDKRSKFYKALNDSIVVFERLKNEILASYILKEINLSDKYITELINVCEGDYSRILLEIDKIKNYQKGLNIEHQYMNEAFCGLLEQDVIYKPPYDAIFDFVDAILLNQPVKSFNLLEQCYAVGESTMVMLSVLYNSAKQVLQVQSFNGSDISKSTGLTGFQIKKAREKTGHYSNRGLIHIMQTVRKVERGIKTGEIEEAIAMPYVLVNIF